MLPFAYAVRNLFRDPVRLLQTVGGSALVVFLMLAAVSFNRGMDEVLSSSGSTQNVILLGKGSEESVERSEVHQEAEGAAKTSIRGLQTVLGEPAVSGEIVLQIPVEFGSDSHPASLRGVFHPALMVHPEVTVTDGHFPRSGQVMVGKLAHLKLGVPTEKLAVGNTIRIGGVDFTIGGHFAAPRTIFESEIWLDRNDLAVIAQRDTLSAVVVRVDEADTEDVEVFALQRNDLEVAAIREDRYYSKLASFYGPIKAMTWLTALLIAAGGFFGGLNTLYAAFASRIREMATLQSIGFTRKALLISLLQESLLASLAGTLLAFCAGLWLLDGKAVSFSIGTFSLQLTAGVLLVGLATGIILGTFGTLPPAIKVLAPPLPKALRSL